MDLIQLLKGPAATLGFGGIAGAIVGYAAKKITKLAAILLGILFIVLQVLADYGFITVNWTAVQSTAERTWQDPQGVTLAERTWDALTAHLPFAGGFAAGFALGFKLG